MNILKIIAQIILNFSIAFVKRQVMKLSASLIKQLTELYSVLYESVEEDIDNLEHLTRRLKELKP